MKKIWYFVASILIIIILVVIAMICGFRITYDPNLENSWDAISACAAWIVGILSAVMSAIAIIVAINVPKEQNKIALFEKRYSVYNAINFLKYIVDQIYERSDIEVEFESEYEYVLYIWENLIETHDMLFNEPDFKYKNTLIAIHKKIFEAEKIKYIFVLTKNEMKLIYNFLSSLNDYTLILYKINNEYDELTNEMVDNYIKKSDALMQNHKELVECNVLEKMQEQLKLSDSIK